MSKTYVMRCGGSFDAVPLPASSFPHLDDPKIELEISSLGENLDGSSWGCRVVVIIRYDTADWQITEHRFEQPPHSEFISSVWKLATTFIVTGLAELRGFGHAAVPLKVTLDERWSTKNDLSVIFSALADHYSTFCAD